MKQSFNFFSAVNCSIVFNYNVSFLACLKLIMRLLKLGQVFRASPLVLRQINNLCGKMYYQARFCNYLISLATGPNPDNLDLVCNLYLYFTFRNCLVLILFFEKSNEQQELLPVLLSVYFSGTSANTMIQFFQNPDLGISNLNRLVFSLHDFF